MHSDKRKAGRSDKRRPGRNLHRSFCDNGMKCKDPSCRMMHPPCRDGDGCKNVFCGFQHSGRLRFTGGTTAPPTMCWKKHKCEDAQCEMVHPMCKHRDACENRKCGFLHPDGKRYTARPPPAAVVGLDMGEVAPLCVEKNGGFISKESLTASGDVFKLRAMNDGHYAKRQSHLDMTFGANSFAPPFAARKPLLGLHEYGKSIKARGQVKQISIDGETAWLDPKLHYFAKHPEFYSAATENSIGALLDFKGATDINEYIAYRALAIDDYVEFQVRLDKEGKLVADAVKIMKLKLDGRSCKQLIALVNVSICERTLQENILVPILDIEEASDLVVGAILVKTHHVWTDCSMIVRARRLQGLFIKSSFLLPHGSLCRQMSKLSPKELHCAHDMLGCMCMLRVEDARLLIHASTILAQRLGKDGSQASSSLESHHTAKAV